MSGELVDSARIPLRESRLIREHKIAIILVMFAAVIPKFALGFDPGQRFYLFVGLIFLPLVFLFKKSRFEHEIIVGADQVTLIYSDQSSESIDRKEFFDQVSCENLYVGFSTSKKKMLVPIDSIEESEDSRRFLEEFRFCSVQTEGDWAKYENVLVFLPLIYGLTGLLTLFMKAIHLPLWFKIVITLIEIGLVIVTVYQSKVVSRTIAGAYAYQFMQGWSRRLLTRTSKVNHSEEIGVQ